MGEGGRGVYMLTKGGHTPMPFLESLAAASGRPVMIAALLHNGTNPQAVFDDLDAIAAANARGHRLLGQVSCCPLTMDFTLASPYPVEGLKSWQPALSLSGRGAEAQARRHGISRRRARRAGDADDLSPVQQRMGQGPGRRGRAAGARRARAEQHRRDRSREGRDPLDAMLDLAIAEDLKTVFTAQLLNSDEEAVGRMLNHPHSIVSLSDAGAHLTFFNDAGFGLHLLGHWARERGAMSHERGGAPADVASGEVLGMSGRGLLREGLAADLLLFDPATVGRGPKRRVHDLPGGAARLTTDAVGVRGVGSTAGRWRMRGPVDESPLAGRVLTEFAPSDSPRRMDGQAVTLEPEIAEKQPLQASNQLQTVEGRSVWSKE